MTQMLRTQSQAHSTAQCLRSRAGQCQSFRASESVILEHMMWKLKEPRPLDKIFRLSSHHSLDSIWRLLKLLNFRL